MAIIGIILLIGIVKKNAIMMIDFALAAERNEGKNTGDSISRHAMLAVPSHSDDDDGGPLGAIPLASDRRVRTPPAAGNLRLSAA